MGRRARLDWRIEEDLKKAFNTTYHHASFLSGGDHARAPSVFVTPDANKKLKNHETICDTCVENEGLSNCNTQ